MKINFILLLFFVAIAIAFLSCAKVVDFDLNNQSPKYVIEANLNDIFERQYVLVSKSVSFNQQSEFVGVTDAIITLTDEDGNVYPFSSQESPGVYFRTLRGIPTKSYILKVKIGATTYTSSSRMPVKVPLDSVSIVDKEFIGRKYIYLKLYYKDPVNLTNQYRFLLSINGRKLDNYNIMEDKFINGKYDSYDLYINKSDISASDSIKFEFQSIDVKMYKYFFSIKQLNKSTLPSVTSFNPNSNFDNGALGFFNAHTSERGLLFKPN